MPAVCVAHHNEDLSWINRLQHTAHVVSNTAKDAYIYTATNIGYEAALYLEYIIREYDTLEEYTFFVHGHQYSSHHDGDLADLINRTACTRPYQNINTADIIQTPRHAIGDLFPNMFECLGLKPVPAMRTRQCAMFYVHRDLIRRHPRARYQEWLNEIYTRKWERLGLAHDDKGVAIGFEWAWFTIFTGELDEIAYEKRCKRSERSSWVDSRLKGVQ